MIKVTGTTVLINDEPPTHPEGDKLHTVNTRGMEGVELEWLEKAGYHTGYLYVDGRGRVLSFYDSDKVIE